MTRQKKNVVGPQVRQLRLQRNWSLDHLAIELALQGVFLSPRTLERIELRREFVGAVEISAFAAVFKIGAEHLFPPDSSTAELAGLLRALPKTGAPNGAAPRGCRQPCD
jgi:transcriptional regulator with XRE-family HTH domain